MQTKSNVVQINPDQARIDAAVKAATTTATLDKRKRCLAISALSKSGLEGKVQAAIESGMSADDFKLWVALPKKDKRPTINTAAVYENRKKPKGQSASANMNKPKG